MRRSPMQAHRHGRVGPQVAHLQQESRAAGAASAAAAAAEGSEGDEATTTSGRGARAPATADHHAKVP